MKSRSTQQNIPKSLVVKNMKQKQKHWRELDAQMYIRKVRSRHLTDWIKLVDSSPVFATDPMDWCRRSEIQLNFTHTQGLHSFENKDKQHTVGNQKMSWVFWQFLFFFVRLKAHLITANVSGLGGILGLEQLGPLTP